MTSSEIEYTTDCNVCGGQFFQSRHPGPRCELCSSCSVCGEPMPLVADQRWDSLCSDSCTETRQAEVEAFLASVAARVTRSKKAFEYKVAARTALFERDGWICHLCDKQVNRDAIWPESDSPVLDHVIPKAKGGGNELSNLKTAHALCNNQRKDMDLELFLSFRVSARR